MIEPQFVTRKPGNVSNMQIWTTKAQPAWSGVILHLVALLIVGCAIIGTGAFEWMLWTAGDIPRLETGIISLFLGLVALVQIIVLWELSYSILLAICRGDEVGRIESGMLVISHRIWKLSLVIRRYDVMKIRNIRIEPNAGQYVGSPNEMVWNRHVSAVVFDYDDSTVAIVSGLAADKQHEVVQCLVQHGASKSQGG